MEQLRRMLRLKWDFRNDKINIPINPFKVKYTFNARNKEAVIEMYLSSLEKKLLKIEVPKDKFNNLTKGEGDALYNLDNDKAIVVKGADKGWAVVVWDREHYIKDTTNQLGDANIYKEATSDAKPLINIMLNTLENIRERGDVYTDTWGYFKIEIVMPSFRGFIFFQKFIKYYITYWGGQLCYIENISFFQFPFTTNCQKSQIISQRH